MYVVDSYKNLLSEIEIVKKRIEGLEFERSLIIKTLHKSAPKDINSVSYDGMPKGSMSHKTLDRTWQDIQRIDSMLFLENEILKNNLKVKNEIENRVKNLKGIQYEVAYKREIEGKNLKDIAEELQCSYDHIRRVHSKYKNATFMPQTKQI